jgi:hypothetical protein
MKRARLVQIVVGGDVGGAERLLVDLATRREKTDSIDRTRDASKAVDRAVAPE